MKTQKNPTVIIVCVVLAVIVVLFFVIRFVIAPLLVLDTVNDAKNDLKITTAGAYGRAVNLAASLCKIDNEELNNDTLYLTDNGTTVSYDDNGMKIECGKVDAKYSDNISVEGTPTIISTDDWITIQNGEKVLKIGEIKFGILEGEIITDSK